MVLDNGANWDPEDFQLEYVEDLFGDHREVWLILPEGNGKTTLLGGVALYHGDQHPRRDGADRRIVSRPVPDPSRPGRRFCPALARLR